jgi:hypothetical protein
MQLQIFYKHSYMKYEDELKINSYLIYGYDIVLHFTQNLPNNYCHTKFQGHNLNGTIDNLTQEDSVTTRLVLL